MAAISGAVIRMDRAMFREGLCDSPAKIATYSKLLSAPKVILLNTLKVNTVSGGATKRRGWNADRDPRHELIKGRPMRIPTVISTAMLPALLNHLPTLNPTAANSICSVIRTTDAAMTAHLLSAIQAREGMA